jgi:hydroxysqualene dehydroxylase
VPFQKSELNVAKFDVAVIGAGWAGCSAAIKLIEQGRQVLLLDAAPQAGGRARRQVVTLAPSYELELDNGQHLLIGAYVESLALIKKVGGQDVIRNPLALVSESGIRLAANNNLFVNALPALAQRAISFLMAGGLTLKDKLSVVSALATLQMRGWDQYCLQGSNGEPNKNKALALTVQGLLNGLRQPPSIQHAFWNPLCIATMNTLATHADAATFCRVLRDSLGSTFLGASDFITPASNLGAAFPDAAIKWLLSAGASIELRHNVTQITPSDDGAGWLINERFLAKQVVLAVPPPNAARLLKGLENRAASDNYRNVISKLEAFEYLPIATIYLGWMVQSATQSQSSGPPAIYMLKEDRSARRPGQWLFARGVHLCEAGFVEVAAVVVSAWDASVSNEALGEQIALQVASLQDANAPNRYRRKADFVKVIVEKRATLACTPERPRLHPDSLRESGLFLAGDYCYPDYPATLEGAVRSGLQAAELALAEQASALDTCSARP